MAEWPFTPEETKIAAGGLFGALWQVYLRHPGKWLRALIMVLFGMGQAMIFTHLVADWTGLPVVPVAFVIGLTGKVLAERMLKAAEKADFTPLMKRKD